jgi:hypothetical protein
MKKFLFILLLLIAGTLSALYFYALPKAKGDIESIFHDAGFTHVEINRLEPQPDGFYIPQLQLDKEGFSKAEGIKIYLFWPDFILKGHINKIDVFRLSLATITDRLINLISFHQKTDLQNLAKYPISHLNVNEILWDTKTPQAALRFSGNFNLKEDGNKKIISLNLMTEQHPLAFESQWSGFLTADGKMELQGNIDSLRINYGPLSVSRGNGWLSYKTNNNINRAFAGQLMAGRGEVFSVPANNISLTIGQSDNYTPVLFRAEAAGLETVRLASDIHWSAEKEHEDFTVTLNIPNLSEFLDYLQTQSHLKNLTLNDYGAFGETKASFTYMPEKRFADGPLPFEAVITEEEEDAVSGTFLIYPDSLDIRGTLSAEEKYMNLLRDAFSIPPENISDDSMRLEGNIKSLLLNRANQG